MLLPDFRSYKNLFVGTNINRVYPFSHNDGSGKLPQHEKKLLLEGPISTSMIVGGRVSPAKTLEMSRKVQVFTRT